MMRHIVTFKQFDIVVVPFPFVDNTKSKPRPVLILTDTTAAKSQWLGDVEIKGLDEAGLNHSSFIRMKLFTLDMRVGARQIGHLSARDKTQCIEKIKSLLPH